MRAIACWIANCKGQSNELSHVFAVKKGKWFLNVWKLVKHVWIQWFSGRLIRNEVYAISDLLGKKSWDFGSAQNIPYATGKARKL